MAVKASPRFAWLPTEDKFIVDAAQQADATAGAIAAAFQADLRSRHFNSRAVTIDEAAITKRLQQILDDPNHPSHAALASSGYGASHRKSQRPQRTPAAQAARPYLLDNPELYMDVDSEELAAFIHEKIIDVAKAHDIVLTDTLEEKIDRAASFQQKYLINIYKHRKTKKVFIGGDRFDFSKKFSDTAGLLREAGSAITADRLFLMYISAPALFNLAGEKVVDNLRSLQLWFLNYRAQTSIDDILNVAEKNSQLLNRAPSTLIENFDHITSSLKIYGLTKEVFFDLFERIPVFFCLPPKTFVRHFELSIAMHEMCGRQKSSFAAIGNDAHLLSRSNEISLLTLVTRRLETLAQRADPTTALSLLRFNSSNRFDRRALQCLLPNDASFAAYQAWLTRNPAPPLAEDEKASNAVRKTMVNAVVDQVAGDIRARHGKPVPEDGSVPNDRFMPHPELSIVNRLPDIILDDVPAFDLKNQDHRFRLVRRLQNMGVLKVDAA